MKCTVTALDGTVWELPQVLEWDISHGFGSPCDSFEVKLLLTGECCDILGKAVYFSAEDGDKTVFHGVIDEYELTAAADGAAAYVRGRGMQARLLDNEAESAEYYLVGLDTLLDNYVRPFGIEKIDASGGNIAKGSLTVDSGASCWSVINHFCSFHAGTSPRFSQEGVLVIDGEKEGRNLVIDDKTPVVSTSLCEDRYGVISSVIVKNKSRGIKTETVSEQHKAKGISCRRIVNVPRAVRYDAMRYTGAYQIEKSVENMLTVQVVLPWAFAAFPGDRVKINSSPVGAEGEYMVAESRCRGSGAGTDTQLTLRALAKL